MQCTPPLLLTSFYSFICTSAKQPCCRYDLPAELDYILRVTGREELAYVAFSQGTTIGFAALSSYPEVAKRIRVRRRGGERCWGWGRCCCLEGCWGWGRCCGLREMLGCEGDAGFGG